MVSIRTWDHQVLFTSTSVCHNTKTKFLVHHVHKFYFLILSVRFIHSVSSSSQNHNSNLHSDLQNIYICYQELCPSNLIGHSCVPYKHHWHGLQFEPRQTLRLVVDPQQNVRLLTKFKFRIMPITAVQTNIFSKPSTVL